MATIALDIQLALDHAPEDTLLLMVGSGHGLTLAESGGGKEIASELVGPLADETPAAVRRLEASHRPPDGCAVLAIGVAVRDAVGNVSTIYETFAEIADHPRGVTPHTVAATGNNNEALFSWIESPDLEGASS